MQNHMILVIGSKNHLRAECFDWLQPFPNIEEYDSIIINMQSLNQKTYDQIQDKIKKMRESIITIIDTGREVFCVFNKPIYPSPPPRRPGEVRCKSINPDYVFPTNYDWLPARIHFDSQKTGSYISLCSSRFKDYFELVHEWDSEISFQSVTAVLEAGDSFLNVLSPVAVNKSQKVVAGSLSRTEDRKKSLMGVKIGIVHLLPPTKESDEYQAIEQIIDIIVGTQSKAVLPWRKDIDVPNECFLNEQITKKLREIEKIQEEISQLQEQIQSWDSYRDLLTETGESLENIVQKTLADIGIKTKKTEKGFPTDLISKEVAVEITGIKGSIGVDSNKVIQTGRFIQNFRKQEKVILIANTYMETQPKDRKGKKNFSPEVRKYFESLSICYLTTETLFELWKKVILEKKEQKCIKEKLLSSNSEVTA